MRQVLRAWPFLAAILCLLYDTKWVLLVLYWNEAPVWMLYVVPVGTAVLELFYWNWFIGWVPQWAQEQERARRAFHEFWEEGFGSRITRLWPNVQALAVAIWDWVVGRWNKEFSHERTYKKVIGRFTLWCFRTMPILIAYPLIAFLSIWPGGFLVAIPLCKTHKIRFGLVTLLLTSAASNCLMVRYGITALDWLFGA
jgi:hypothetical protein